MEVERRDEAAPLSLGGPSTLSPGSWTPPDAGADGGTAALLTSLARGDASGGAPAPNKSLVGAGGS
jgi:hypothetical protein